MKSSTKPRIGWREWVALPKLGAAAIKAKIDTGARSSALHVHIMEIFRHGSRVMVRFKIYPFQRDTCRAIVTEAELVDQRWVRSSSGHETMRPVIITEVELMGHQWPIELTLTNRNNMGFRMLLGRQAVRRHFVVDPGQSFLAGKGSVAKRKKSKRRGCKEKRKRCIKKGGSG